VASFVNMALTYYLCWCYITFNCSWGLPLWV